MECQFGCGWLKQICENKLVEKSKKGRNPTIENGLVKQSDIVALVELF